MTRWLLLVVMAVQLVANVFQMRTIQLQRHMIDNWKEAATNFQAAYTNNKATAEAAVVSQQVCLRDVASLSKSLKAQTVAIQQHVELQHSPSVTIPNGGAVAYDNVVINNDIRPSDAQLIAAQCYVKDGDVWRAVTAADGRQAR